MRYPVEMLRLVVGNRIVTLEGSELTSVRRQLAERTSYLVAGHYHAPAFREKLWDGREHLLKYSDKRGYHFPKGLLRDVEGQLEELGVEYKIVDEQVVRGELKEVAFNVQLRPYQVEAVEAITAGSPDSVDYGVGALCMPARSGKTKTSAAVIHKLGTSAIWIVPSQLLLQQTVDSLKECFPTESIGVVGGGRYEIERFTVATIQTLTRMRGKRGGRKPDPRYKELVKAFDAKVLDELHHVRGGGEWHLAYYDFDTRYCVGLSATLFPDRNEEQGRGIIWARAICGQIRTSVEASHLVEEGYLLRQNVVVYEIDRPLGLRGAKWSKELLRKAINENEHRNRKIAKIAKHFADRSKRVLVATRHFEQINALLEIFDDLGVRYHTVTGRDSLEARSQKIEEWTDPSDPTQVVVGTVFKEGVDVPNVEIVINAEGGRDPKATIQRMRNMTVSEGKGSIALIDFYDRTNRYFENHSKERLKVYEGDAAFSVRRRK